MAGPHIWEHDLEEYKLCEESRHHHERTMWQLLGFFLAVTGVLLNFWLSAEPFTEIAKQSNSFLILFIPLLLGLFTTGALLKHKFFWRLELRRAIDLEGRLQFSREGTYAKELYSHPLRYLRSGEMAFLAVVLTILGIGYLIGRSLWFKPATAPGQLFWFPIYVAGIPGGLSAYGMYRIFRVNRERELEGLKPESKRSARSWISILVGFGLGVLGSFLLWWSLEQLLESAVAGSRAETIWLGFWQTITSLILLLSVVVVLVTSLLLWKKAARENSAQKRTP